MAFTVDYSKIRSLPKAARELFVKVANAYIQHNGEEGSDSAQRIAWSALEKAGYKKDGHKWEGGASVGVMMKSCQPFSAPLSFVKAETKNGQPYIVLRASGPKVDRQGEQMSEGALQKMIAKAKSGGVELLDNHYSSFDMGKSDDAWMAKSDKGDDELHFGIVGNALNPFLPMLLKDIADGKCNKHTSVGGNVIEAHWEHSKVLGKAVRVLDDVDIDHVAVTRHEKSAYQFDESSSFVGAIMKQLDLPNSAEKVGENMKKEEILALLKQAAEGAETMLKGLTAAVTPDMFEKSEKGLTLKKEFEGILSAVPENMTDEQKTEFGKSMESICKALGVPMTKSETATAEEKDRAAKKLADEKAAKEKEGKDDEAEKAVTTTLLKSAVDELTKAQTEVETLKKSQGTTASDLSKAIVQVSELKAQVQKMATTAVAARPQAGNAPLVRKSTEEVSTKPEEMLEKVGTGDGGASAFVKSIKEKGAALLHKGRAHFTPDEMVKSKEYGEVLKVAATCGPEEAMKRFGKPTETV